MFTNIHIEGYQAQSQTHTNFGDSSGPLFSIYSKTAEEEDNKNAESWKNDADGILIFVRPPVAIQACFVPKLEHYRPVYSLLQLLHSLA
jgi:hypothetical protein